MSSTFPKSSSTTGLSSSSSSSSSRTGADEKEAEEIALHDLSSDVNEAEAIEEAEEKEEPQVPVVVENPATSLGYVGPFYSRPRRVRSILVKN